MSHSSLSASDIHDIAALVFVVDLSYILLSSSLQCSCSQWQYNSGSSCDGTSGRSSSVSRGLTSSGKGRRSDGSSGSNGSSSTLNTCSISEASKPGNRIGITTLVFMQQALEALVEFWCAALHSLARHPQSTSTWQEPPAMTFRSGLFSEGTCRG